MIGRIQAIQMLIGDPQNDKKIYKRMFGPGHYTFDNYNALYLFTDPFDDELSKQSCIRTQTVVAHFCIFIKKDGKISMD